MDFRVSDRLMAGANFVSDRTSGRATAGHVRLWLRILVAMFLATGLVFKSFLFAGGEPTIASYVLNAVIIGAMLGILLIGNRLIPIGRVVFVGLAFAICWALVSSYWSGIAMNYVATITMLVMLAGSFYALPLASSYCDVEPWRLVNIASLTMVVISAVMAVVTPSLVIDPENGRFSGSFLSVAVACNFFLFATALSVAAAVRAQSSRGVYVFLALAALSFVLLYLTRTRSALLEAIVIVGIIAVASPMARGLKMAILAIAGWVLVLLIMSGAVVTTGLVSIDEQLQEFRLADDSLTSARNTNWEFGLLRIGERPWVGEGLLSKQTEGGTMDLQLGEGSSGYNPTYDPHSLPLSLAVEGGIPFMIAVLGAIIAVIVRFLRRFGLVRSLQSPDFVVVAVHLPVMAFAGGDLTTLGNMVEKTFWILLGALEIKNCLVAPSDRPGRFSMRQSRLLPAPVTGQPLRRI